MLRVWSTLKNRIHHIRCGNWIKFCSFLYWSQPNTDVGNTAVKGNGENRGKLEGLRAYTPTSHASTNSSQEAQRKAGGLRYLKGSLGLWGRRGGGMDGRRNTDCRLQLSHKAATERQWQPAKAVWVWHGEKEREWEEEQEKEEDMVNMEPSMTEMHQSKNKGAWKIDSVIQKWKWICNE